MPTHGPTPMHPMFVRLAERAALDPYYLASRLGPDLRATAARLGISVEACCHLYLCPVPKDEGELRRIAGRGWATEEQLRQVMGW